MTPNVVFRCHYYTKKSKEYAFYSSQKSNSDYLNYIDKGIKDGHPVDYLAYSGNPEKSSGLFGPSGLLSFREKAKVRKKLRATDSQIWDCVISFEENFGKEHMKSYLDAKNLLNDELPNFLKSNGMDITNVTWVAGLHENTENRHIHLCFFENEPRRIVANKKERQYHNGSLKQVSIDDFKVRIEQGLTGAKFSIFSERDEILSKADSYFDSEIDSRSLFDRRLRESLESLYQKLPEGGTDYSSHRTDEIRDEVDSVTRFFLMKDNVSSLEYLTFLKKLSDKDEETKRVCESQHLDPSPYLLSEKLQKDLYRRIGNKVLKYLRKSKNQHSSIKADYDPNRKMRWDEKKRRSYLFSHLKSLGYEVSEERNGVFDEYERLLEKAEYERMLENGVIKR